MPATDHPAFARIMPFLFVFLWSTGFVGAKFGLPYADPFTFLFARFAIVIVLMVPVISLLVLGLIVVALVLVPKIGDGIGITAFGIGLAIMALFGMTAGTLYQKRFCTGMDLMSGTVIQYVAAAAFVGVVALIKEPLVIEWSMNFILAMAWLVLVLSIGAIMLLMVLIKQGEATRVASMFYLVPPTAAFFAWLLFDEHLGMLGFAGFAIAALGVALVMVKR